VIKVLVVDDHAIVRQGYVRLINSDSELEVFAEASSGEEGYELLKSVQPDVVITDLTMPGFSGLKLLQKALDRDKDAKVVICSMHDTIQVANSALNNGAKGFVSKSADPHQILEAIHAAYRGEVYLSKEIRAQQLMNIDSKEQKRIESLSVTEFEIFKMLAEGKPIATIAIELNLSEKTIHNHQTFIRKKLVIDTPASLVHLAMRNGIIRNPQNFE
jgi:DNA-binding NarL/FixJ family response regulator